MSLTTRDVYGAPKYGPIGRPPGGVIFHTPEWGDNPALQNAINCAAWQATTGNKSGGSYHGILGHNGPENAAGCGDPEHWVMVRSVPWDQAAGGMTSDHTPPTQISPRTGKLGVWAPQRYPWIQQLLTPAAFADPNRWLHQIALAGAAAWFVANGYPKGALIRLAEWVKTLEGAYTYDAVLMLHRLWQVDRTDPGPLDLPDLILAEYHKLGQPAPEPAPDPRLAQLEERLADKNAALDRIATLRLPPLQAALDQVKESIRYTKDDL